MVQDKTPLRFFSYVFVLVSAVFLRAAPPLELFVAPTGDDTAQGTRLEAPLRSLTEAISRVKAAGGGKIRVLPGIYTGDVETFPLMLGPRTTIEAFDPSQKPVIGGTRVNSVFWVHDIPGEVVPWPAEGEPSWPLPDADAPVLSGLRIEEGGGCPGGAGGGINLSRGSVLLLDCDIIANHAGYYGGGIGAADASKVIAERCRINRNTRKDCGVVGTPGTGVALLLGSVGAFRDCEISQNVDPEDDALFVDHGSQLFLKNCKVLDNYSGGLFAPESNVFMDRCVLSGHPICLCSHPPIEIFYGRLIMRDSLIYGNGIANAISISNTPALIDGCVVAYNDGTGGPALYANYSFDEPAKVLITNSIFWANGTIYNNTFFPDLKPEPAVFLRSGEIRYSIVQHHGPTEFPIVFDHVFDADPLFRDFRRGDLSFLPGSPAIDAGDPNFPPDPDGSRRDIGVTFPELAPRYLFMRGDPNGDGVTDITDAVRILLGLFHDPALLPCPDAADYDDNGAVEITDAIDLLRFLFLPTQVGPRPPFGYYAVDWTEDALDCKW